MSSAAMRITFVQYGDYRETWHRFEEGGDETYAGQRYSVDIVRDLAASAEDVCVACVAAGPYEETLSSGVRVIGRRMYESFSESELVELVRKQRPTHLIARSPIVPLLRWATRTGIRTLPILATSFPRAGLRAWLGHRRVASALNDPRIEWVGNHNLNSSRALARIGVDPNRIVPWDWPPDTTPNDFIAKSRPATRGSLRLFYAGRIQETKGIGDCVRAVAMLHRRGLDVSLTAAGAGEIDDMRLLSIKLGIEGRIQMLGRISHREVVDEMHKHDAVLVPSQHAYPEGLPLTIYDAYCSRSPLIASDHPMFRDKVVHGETALIFRASDASALAVQIETLMRNETLYEHLSQNSLAAWERLQIPVRWGDFLQRWLRNEVEDQRWLANYCLASGIYP